MKLLTPLAMISLLAACSPPGSNNDNERKDRGERRVGREDRGGADRKGDNGAERGAKKGKIAQADTNGDGEITATEFTGKKRRFDQMDTNGDGKLSGSELQ